MRYPSWFLVMYFRSQKSWATVSVSKCQVKEITLCYSEGPKRLLTRENAAQIRTNYAVLCIILGDQRQCKYAACPNMNCSHIYRRITLLSSQIKSYKKFSCVQKWVFGMIQPRLLKANRLLEKIMHNPNNNYCTKCDKKLKSKRVYWGHLSRILNIQCRKPRNTEVKIDVNDPNHYCAQCEATYWKWFCQALGESSQSTKKNKQGPSRNYLRVNLLNALIWMKGILCMYQI